MSHKTILNFLLLALSLCVPPVLARETGFLNRTVTVGSATYRYQVYVPAIYDSHKKLPVILYLHGLSYRGDDGLLPTEIGVGGAIRRQAASFPAIAVFPQCRMDAAWSGDMEIQALKAMDESVKEFNGDTKRLYLIGLSFGGYGAWYFSANHPGKFAAVVPISGGIYPWPGTPLAPLKTEYDALVKSSDACETFARLIGKTPVWIFHGGADPLIPVTEARKMAELLKTAGGNVKYTEYPGIGHAHAGPMPAYTLEVDRPQTDPEFITWLFAQHLD